MTIDAGGRRGAKLVLAESRTRDGGPPTAFGWRTHPLFSSEAPFGAIARRLPLPVRLMAIAIALLVATLVTVAAPQIASAAGSCINPGASHLDGMLTHTPTYSVDGDIMNRPINLCSGKFSDVSVWVMVQGNASEYAQVGYLQTTGHSTYYFFEWNDGNGNSLQDTFTPYWNAGETHNYSVTIGSNGKASMWFESTVIETTPFNALTTWSITPRGTFAGETHDLQDDMPGTSAHKVRFTNLRERDCITTCAWDDPSVASIHIDSDGGHSFYKFEWVTNPTYFRIWTER